MQVTQRLFDHARHRPPVVDVERAAFGEHRIEQRIAAHGMIPGHPVEVSRLRCVRIARTHLHHHRRIGAHHALRVDNRLGHAGRTRREQQLAHGIRRDCCNRLLDFFGHRRCRKLRECDALDVLARSRDMDDGHATEIERLQRLLESRAVLHHHHGWLDQAEQVFQLDVVVAHQRIRRRYRGCRKPPLHRRQSHQGVLDGIAGKDRNRAAWIQLQIEKGLRQRVDGALGLSVRHLAPLPVIASALR